jgi:hypothetical protein
MWLSPEDSRYPVTQKRRFCLIEIKNMLQDTLASHCHFSHVHHCIRHVFQHLLLRFLVTWLVALEGAGSHHTGLQGICRRIIIFAAYILCRIRLLRVSRGTRYCMMVIYSSASWICRFRRRCGGRLAYPCLQAVDSFLGRHILAFFDLPLYPNLAYNVSLSSS